MEAIRLSDNRTLVIKGSIRSEFDYQEIKTQMSAMRAAGAQEFALKLIHSTTITSSVLGYWLKLVNHDHFKLSLEATDVKILHLLQELGLLEVFNATLLED